MNIRRFKNLSLEVVSETALHIVQDQGYVTTLEIKKSLRNQGYFAVQAEVSSCMQQLYLRGNRWDYYSNGKFRIYFDPRIMFQFDLQMSFSLN